MARLSERKFYPWLVVALLWVVALLNYMDRQILSTMRESMMVDISQLESAANFGRLMAVFLWIYGIVGPFAGAIADRLNRKWLIIGSLAVWSFVTLLMGYASSFEQMYWLRALMGVSEALYIPAALALIADWHSGKSRGLAIGVHMTGLYIGQALGGFGATVASRLSWQETFHVFGIVGVAYSLVLILFLREKRLSEDSNMADCQPSGDKIKLSESSKESIIATFIGLFKTFPFLVILFYFAAISLPGWASKNWLPTLFGETLSVPMSEAGPIATITLAAASFVGVLAGGALSDRWVLRNIRGRVYTLSLGLVFCMAGLVLLGFGSGLAASVLSGICFGFGWGFLDANNMPIVCQFIPVRRRAAAYGVMNMAGVFSGAVVTSLFGEFTDGGKLGLAFAGLAAGLAITLAAVFLLLRPKTDNMA